MQYAYVTVIEAANETEARAYVERNLHPYQPNSPCRMLGGGTGVSKSKNLYVTGEIAAVVAKDAFDGQEDQRERLASALHAEITG